MQLISSRLTFFYKRIFPLVFFAMLLVFLVVSIRHAIEAESISAAIFPLLVFILAGGMGYLAMKRLSFDLADEVLEEGTSLVIRKAGREERIAFADILNVSYAPYLNPPRVTLLLRRSSLFGDQIAFAAPARFVPFASSPVIDTLIRRIAASRDDAAAVPGSIGRSAV